MSVATNPKDSVAVEKALVTASETVSECQPGEFVTQWRAETIQPTEKQVRKHRPSWIRGSLMLARRAHLYAGLLLVPWVFLYGFTGFLFNHPSWFSNQLFIDFGAREMAGTTLDGIATPRQMADEVIGQLNSRFGTRYEIVSPETAALGRGGLNATLEMADKSNYQLTISASGQGGTVRPARGVRGPVPGGRGGMAGANVGGADGTRPGRRDERSPGNAQGDIASGRNLGLQESVVSEGKSEPESPQRRSGGGRGIENQNNNDSGGAPETRAPFTVTGGLDLVNSPIDRMRAGLPQLLRRLSIDDAKVASVQMMPLTFLMKDKQTTWEVHYSASSGEVTGHIKKDQTAAAGSLAPRTFLTNLHKAHGYPTSETNARTFWAVIVDIMSSVMILWGVTGLVMWWQIKRTRVSGGVCLALSLAGAIWLGIGMHAVMLPQ
jgi:hypothetical protein